MARIIVIEDDPAVGQVLVRMLQHSRHDVILCPTAAQALQALHALQSGGADLVIVDLLLPDRSGLEVIAEMRTGYPQLPVIAITGAEARAGQDLLVEAVELGVVKALRKPFGPDALFEAVAVALYRPGGSEK